MPMEANISHERQSRHFKKTVEDVRYSFTVCRTFPRNGFCILLACLNKYGVGPSPSGKSHGSEDEAGNGC